MVSGGNFRSHGLGCFGVSRLRSRREPDPLSDGVLGLDGGGDLSRLGVPGSPRWAGRALVGARGAEAMSRNCDRGMAASA